MAVRLGGLTSSIAFVSFFKFFKFLLSGMFLPTPLNLAALYYQHFNRLILVVYHVDGKQPKE